MRRIILSILFSLLFCQIAFAGEWKTDETGTRYIQDDGTYATGWKQDVDGKWYYLDDSTGYMLLSSRTPDGFTADASGAWTEEEVMTVNLDGYDNFVELNVETPKNQLIVYSGPLKVHYNNRYKNSLEGYINVLNVMLSKDGIPYLQINTEDIGKYITVKMAQSCKFTLSDGTTVDINTTIEGAEDWTKENYSFSILGGYEMYEIFRKNTVTSVEVWINEYVPTD